MSTLTDELRTLAEEGSKLHSPGMPEYTLCRGMLAALADIARLQAALRGFVDRNMTYFDGLTSITVSRGAVLAARELLPAEPTTTAPRDPFTAGISYPPDTCAP